jgi:hypothetical protein
LPSKITNAAKAIPNVQSTIFHFVAYLGVLHSRMRLSSNISVHRVMFNPGRTVFNCAALLVVDENGGYNQTIDHECLNKFFEIQSLAK